MFSKTKDDKRKRAARKPERKKPKVRRRTRPVAGLVAGIIGGVVATWVLDNYQRGAAAATREGEKAAGLDPVLSRQQEEQQKGHQRAHGEVAERVTRAISGTGLSSRQRRQAAPYVHYAVGAIAGGIYGFSVEIVPMVRTGYGTGYASLLFLGGQELLVPGLDLGPAPQKTPSAVQAGGLSAHMVYGATLETVRRLLRWLF
jgi:ferric-dicitrate binding protein FerR (iron transport regulator)